jgi:hypothetical protein
MYNISILKEGSSQHLYIRNQILIMKIGEAVSNETLLSIFQSPGRHIRHGSTCHSVLSGCMKHLQTKGHVASVSCIYGP